VLLAVGLAGDWLFVVATILDVSVAVVEAVRARGLVSDRVRPMLSRVVFGVALASGLTFLARHDTESGHVSLLSALGALLVLSFLVKGRAPGWTRRRMAWAMAGAWAVPLAALFAANGADPAAPWASALINRCRFAAVPTDDVERLAVWCRGHTPAGARFIGPPGPKTFRLWSQRSLAFNRAASPYHAAGLADWAARFRDHVGFDGPAAALVRAYQDDRHGLERRYQAMSDAQRAALAICQGADYVVAAPPTPDGRAASAPVDDAPLELLHVEGRYAVYRVRKPGAMTARPPAPAHERRIRLANPTSAECGLQDGCDKARDALTVKTPGSPRHRAGARTSPPLPLKLVLDVHIGEVEVDRRRLEAVVAQDLLHRRQAEPLRSGAASATSSASWTTPQRGR
jgi:hypothetical protein